MAFGSLVIDSVYHQKAAEKAGLERRALKAPSFPPVTEDAGFDYTKTEPLQLRPFKPTYHLTMGRFYPHSALLSADDSPSDSIEPPALETLDPEDLILMDKNYPSRIKYRKDIMEKHHDNVVNATKDNRIDAAVKEFYIFIMGTYLPSRYPSMFKLHKSEYDSGMTYMLENQVTGQIFPASPLGPATKTVTLLETLAFSIDEEFLFLLPEEESDVEKASIPKYVLHAYTCICASGFNPSEKIGKRLVDIHEPVPSYVDKLDRSMDRFFDKIEVGKYVKRVNWSITTDGDLYAAGDGTNHARKDEEVQELKELDLDQVCADMTFRECAYTCSDICPMRAPNAAPASQVESASLCFQDISVSPSADQRGRLRS